jgi:hypothetical protein
MLDQMRFLSLSWKIFCFIKVGKLGILVAIYGLSFLDSTSFFIARGLGHGRQIDS